MDGLINKMRLGQLLAGNLYPGLSPEAGLGTGTKLLKNKKYELQKKISDAQKDKNLGQLLTEKIYPGLSSEVGMVGAGIKMLENEQKNRRTENRRNISSGSSGTVRKTAQVNNPGRGRKNAKPVLMEKKSAGSPETGSGFFGRLFGKSVPEKKTSYLSWNKILGKNVLPGKTAGSSGLAGAAKEAGVVEDNSAWETFRKIRDSVNEVPYPQYRGLKNIEKHNAVGDTQNLLILNREAQEERELVAKQWEWKRKYGSPRDILKRELMSQILKVPADMLAPEPYPVGKKDKKGKSQRDVSWARAGQMGEAGFKADKMDAEESGRRMTTAGTLTDHEMGRKAELQSRREQIDADKGVKTLNSANNLEGKKYQVDMEREKTNAMMLQKIGEERLKREAYYRQLAYGLEPAKKAMIKDLDSWVKEQADQDITRAYGPQLNLLNNMR